MNCEAVTGAVDGGTERRELPQAPATAGRRIRVQTQFSPGFGDWLIRHRVGLVASTYQAGQLLFIGVKDDGTPIPSAIGFDRAMGLHATPQQIQVGTAHGLWRLENVLGANEIDNGMFDRLYTPRTCQVTGDINIHELAVEDDGRVVFCNTLYSCISTIHASKAFEPIWKPRFISNLAPEDRCHLNGLALDVGKLRLVTCCSTGDALESWRGGRRDGGVLIDVDSDEIVVSGLSMPHSPRIQGDKVFVVESGRGALVRMRLDGSGREDVAFLPGFARGLSLIGGYAVLTISLPRISAFEGLPIADTMRKRGATPWRGLMIVDLRSGNIVEWLRIEGDITEMFDVKTVSAIRARAGTRTERMDHFQDFDDRARLQ